MKKTLLVFMACVLSLFSIASFAGQQNDSIWRSYIDGTVGKSFYYLYGDVKHKYFHTLNKCKYRALDLGIGSGNEAIDLVSERWEVLGIDSSSRANEIISERVRDLPGRFEFQLGDFSTVRLNGYYQLVMSFFALPFGNKKELPALLNNVSQHMQSGAVFVGNFFGETHDFVKKGQAFSVTKEELLNYFAAIQFKVVFFLNRIYDQRDFEGDKVHWDIFDVIAVKL